VLDEARQRLLAHQGFDYRDALARLAAEAVSRMAGTNFALQLSEADRAALGDGLAEGVRRRVGREGIQVTVAAEAAKIDGGVIVRDAEGRQVWDNSLRARLDRFWPILRREIGVRTSLAGRSAEKES
jgi:vacuolar-type H+-ATPase subunit E/Vma4